MARIYISSSFEDLKEQRRCVQEVLRRLGHVPVCMEKYRASERPPLKVCLSDVASCEGYVGLLAFRYGSLAEPQRKSFTHLEYEKAIESEIPPLMFLLSEKADWETSKVDLDQAQIRAFRAQVSRAHIVREFTDLRKLSREVEAAVTERFGRGQEHDLLQLLPYLCDCSDQENALADAVRRRRPGRPLVCIVHGDDFQSHDDFLRRLRERTFPDLLRLEDVGIQSLRMSWPDRQANDLDTVKKLLLQQLSKIFRKRPWETPWSKHEIQKDLAAQRGPALVHTLVLTETWLQQGNGILDQFLGFWQDWPELEEGQDLFVVLLVQYQLKRNLPEERRAEYLNRNTEIRRQIDALEAGVLSRFDRIDLVVLPVLDGVSLRNALDWADDVDLRSLATSDRIARDLRTVFERWEQVERETKKMPMEDFAILVQEEILLRYSSLTER